MSVALSGRDVILRAALPRGAGAIVLVLAIMVHLAGGVAVYWAAQTDGTEAAGEGGLTVGLGPSGAPPGALEAVEAEPVDTATPEAATEVEAEDATSEVAPQTASDTTPDAADDTPDASPDTDVPPVEASEVAAPSAPDQSLDLAESVDPVIAPSDAPTPPEETPADPETAAGPAPDTSPEVVAPDSVTAEDQEEGLGVSRRPASRPEAVEEAGRRAAEETTERAETARRQRRAAEAEREGDAPAPQSEGRQGQSGSSQGSTRGGGDGTEGGGNPGARADFAAVVAARLAQAKQYPRRAQRARIEGTGTIWFRMNAAGQVVEARVTRGTGHDVLDQALMETLQRARLPRIPADVDRDQMEFSVPISFTLR